MTPFFRGVLPLYRNLRIKQKVFVLISLVMAVCFSVTFISLQYAYTIYDEQLYEKSSQVLNLSSSGIESELRKIDSLSFNVATDPGIQGMLRGLNGDAPEYEKHRLRLELQDKLVQYAGYEPYVQSVVITDSQGYDHVVGQTGPVSDARKRLIRLTAEEGLGESRWVYPDTPGERLVAARDIRSYQSLELNSLGTLAMRIKSDTIVEDAVKGTELQNGQLVIMAGGSMLFGKAGTLEALPNPGEFSSSHGYVIKEMDGEPYFFTQVRSSYSGWTYYSLIPYGHIFNRIVLMKNVLLIGFLCSLVAVMAVAIQFARGITRPMDKLVERMKQVQKGDFAEAEAEIAAADANSLSMDEVGQLHRTFRVMIGQINELITENYAKQLTIKETQFKALQAQINPHFLYNTLESINWMAKMNGQPRISQMVEALGFLLRSAISMKETLITLEEELEIVKNYITIQKFRFEERLIFEMDVPEGVRSCRIPKLTLQPLLENAIQYGLEPMIDPCLIRVAASAQGDGLLLTVEDAGAGMDPDLLELVRRGEQPSRGNGIGLNNIKERIVIAFGEPYGVDVDSEPGRGTKVSIRLPLEMEG
ncbi:sensor histidine kinase [Paenibacillus mucilaginosus]|uniref:histidine kinase n=3 Tax=Paenibacillus mucilaginosus TaxID=61624 RepID=H6NN46_9BACL|nr:sensor histidine kinase [Paenibacillus mucilaginosus]AEI44170.1 integral membrane sensor signal transduction histidine kinase [Paenibacillus mucilaginosus KNP414]AFC31722.1 integral membrane sensor signal transduction histidine kinase [Paenibacillus mucilaginosus 3016]AFH64074.2 histidine kinase [Paenibacillus mucilaginosus K02]MCG7212369.1 sensor histidine kinase [Paenibacillus mucilaginosus]WDM25587.1 sensor histidine kinase [Paenibacillus mucilaginosus]